MSRPPPLPLFPGARAVGESWGGISPILWSTGCGRQPRASVLVVIRPPLGGSALRGAVTTFPPGFLLLGLGPLTSWPGSLSWVGGRGAAVSVMKPLGLALGAVLLFWAFLDACLLPQPGAVSCRNTFGGGGFYAGIEGVGDGGEGVSHGLEPNGASRCPLLRVGFRGLAGRRSWSHC